MVTTNRGYIQYLIRQIISHLVRYQPRPDEMSDLSYHHLPDVIRMTTARIVGR